MKTLTLQEYLRLKFSPLRIVKAKEQVKAIGEKHEKLSATQQRLQAYCECPLHPLK